MKPPKKYILNENQLYDVIGSNIKKYRNKAGLTQMQLAERALISKSYLSKIEASGCSKSFSISTINRIANALEIDIKDLLELDENYGKKSK